MLLKRSTIGKKCSSALKLSFCSQQPTTFNIGKLQEIKWPINWSKPSEITNEDLLQLKSLYDLKQKEPFPLPAPFALPISPLKKIHMNAASDLFLIASRYGEKTFNDVYENIKKLPFFLTEIPSESLCIRYHQKNKNVLRKNWEALANSGEGIPPQSDWVTELVNSLNKTDEIESKTPYRLKFLQVDDRKRFDEIFVGEDSADNDPDVFKCHPLLRASLGSLFDIGQLKKTLEMVEYYLEMMDEFYSVPTVVIKTAKPLGETQQEKIKSFARRKLKLPQKAKINFDIQINESIMAGLMMIVKGELIDLSLSKKVSDIAKRV